MWADPVDNDTGKLDGLVKANDSRGCSYYFGYELAKNFLKKKRSAFSHKSSRIPATRLQDVSLGRREGFSNSCDYIFGSQLL